MANWRTLYKEILPRAGIGTRRELTDLVNKMYVADKMSGNEISEELLGRGIRLSARSIQRMLRVPRNRKESFRLAMAKGRVRWVKGLGPKARVRRPRVTFSVQMAMRRAYDWTCAACGWKETNDARFSTLVIDHRVPIWKGGVAGPTTVRALDEVGAENLQLLCVPCHEEKTRRDMIEWRETYGPIMRGGAVSGKKVA